MTIKICILDPALADNKRTPSFNQGDLIIADAVESALNSISWIGGSSITRVSTHTFPGRDQWDQMKQSDLLIVGGSNLMSGNILRKRQWRMTLLQYMKIRNVLLMGVGWWQYMPSPTWFTRSIMRNSLSRRFVHSVRDGYTANQLSKLGYQNVINTGCPTMWSLDGAGSGLPKYKARCVVFTLTDYSQSPEADGRLINVLSKLYDDIFFWPQGRRDKDYMRSISNHDIKCLDHKLSDFDELLGGAAELDYVGTRLHGGIRALQFGRRALILSVDNRAVEIGRDTGLPVVARESTSAIEDHLNRNFDIKISVDKNSIEQWKSQFIDAEMALPVHR